LGASYQSNRNISYLEKYYRQDLYSRGLHAQAAGGLDNLNNILGRVYIAGRIIPKQQEDYFL